MKNMVDYVWEERFYTGQLLAVHIGGKYLAYGIKGNFHNISVFFFIFLNKNNENFFIFENQCHLLPARGWKLFQAISNDIALLSNAKSYD